MNIEQKTEKTDWKEWLPIAGVAIALYHGKKGKETILTQIDEDDSEELSWRHTFYLAYQLSTTIVTAFDVIAYNLLN